MRSNFHILQKNEQKKNVCELTFVLLLFCKCTIKYICWSTLMFVFFQAESRLISFLRKPITQRAPSSHWSGSGSIMLWRRRLIMIGVRCISKINAFTCFYMHMSSRLKESACRALKELLHPVDWSQQETCYWKRWKRLEICFREEIRLGVWQKMQVVTSTNRTGRCLQGKHADVKTTGQKTQSKMTENRNCKTKEKTKQMGRKSESVSEL